MGFTGAAGVALNGEDVAEAVERGPAGLGNGSEFAEGNPHGDGVAGDSGGSGALCGGDFGVKVHSHLRACKSPDRVIRSGLWGLRADFACCNDVKPPLISAQAQPAPDHG